MRGLSCCTFDRIPGPKVQLAGQCPEALARAPRWSSFSRSSDESGAKGEGWEAAHLLADKLSAWRKRR